LKIRERIDLNLNFRSFTSDK